MSVEDAINKIAEVLQKLQVVPKEAAAAPDTGKGLQLQPYDETSETFETYMDRIDNYIELKNLSLETEDDGKKCVQILLNCLGPKLYQTLVSLTAPDHPKSKNYKELTALLRTHFCPRPSEVAEQHKFVNRVQHEGESLAKFQAELKTLATHCNFTCSHCKKSTISTHLRSQFIRGVLDSDIREKLLQQSPESTIDDIMKLGLSIEASKAESREMRSQLQAVNYVNKTQGMKPSHKNKRYTEGQKPRSTELHKQSKSINCFKCGSSNHKANKCSAKNL